MVYKAEYIWIDGTVPTARLRSKTKVVADDVAHDALPIWGFDGSSTNQAPGDNSDCVLRPVAVYPDPIRGGDDVLVMCEVLLIDMTPHPTNSRAKCAAIAEKFGLDLSDAPTMLTLRGWTREKDGRIHCDSTAKRVTVLLYLNPEGESWREHQGCLRLVRGPDDIEDFAVEVPPVNGTLLVFPNGPTTWHGHKQFVGQRYSVQLNYMTTDQMARSELRRHRISALVKRLTRAA